MLGLRIYAPFAVILALAVTPTFAQQPEHQQHHPGKTPPAAEMRGPGMPGGGMAGSGGMPMMGMMGMMMGQDGMGGMSMMAGHVEGRLAFLKTELKITDAQLPLWNAVADAIRDNAKGMGAMAEGMMGNMQAATLPDKLAAREKMLTGRLEALRKLKAAADPLYAELMMRMMMGSD